MIPSLGDKGARHGMEHVLPSLVFMLAGPPQCPSAALRTQGMADMAHTCPRLKWTLEKKACLSTSKEVQLGRQTPQALESQEALHLFPSPLEHFRFAMRKLFLVFSPGKVCLRSDSQTASAP